jgi:hypothetical protein
MNERMKSPDESSCKETHRALPRPAGNTVSKSMPLSDWLTLMLKEIEQKSAEATAASDEQKRRESPACGGA